MIKNIILTLGTIALMFSCSDGVKYAYDIQGTVSDSTYNGKMIYIYDFNTEDLTLALDSALIENGTFIFEGHTEKPMLFVLQSGELRGHIIQEEGIKVELGIGQNITAGTLNIESAQMEKDVAAMKETYFAALNALAEGDEAGRQEKHEKYTNEMKAYFDEVIGRHGVNMLGVIAMLERDFSSLEELDAIAAKVPMSKDIIFLQKKREAFLSLEKTSIGKMFVDFSGESIDGSPAKLSEYVGKGKVVLVDFWASWCGPCHAIVPRIQAMQKMYGDDLTILSVNVMDNKEGFKKVIDEGKMTWNHIYASHDRKATELYGVNGIPTLIVFDKDGKIVSRGHGGEFENSLESLLKK